MHHRRSLPSFIAALLLVLVTGCASLPGAPEADVPAPMAAARDLSLDAPRQPASVMVQPGQALAAAPVSAPAQPAATPVPEAESARATPTVISQDVTSAEAPRVPEHDLWTRIRNGFAMPELASPLVAEKERFYLARPAYLERMFVRGGRYLFFIVEELEKRGMPMELALLPFVESAMNPVALSPAQAAGLWQFIPSTGRAYDLRQDWWVDNRRDVVQSTRAALDYLQKIHAMHGNDWFLALASYNWGEGAVARAVRRNQSLGKPGDYLSLSMPAETRHYVPKLMALRNIVLRAEQLGLNLPPVPNRPYFAMVEKTRPIDLELAARFAGMSVDEFVALNPAHNRPVISATRNNQIKLPADRVERFQAAIEQHAAESKAFATWEPYTLKDGESLESLARRVGVSVVELRRANGLREGARIVAGTRLLAPHASGSADEERIEHFVAPRVYEQIEQPARYHTVGKRESLASIASRYRIPAATLAAWNNLRDGVTRGARLLVQPAGTQTLLTTEDGQRTVVSQPVSLKTSTASEATQTAASAAAVATPRTRTARDASQRAAVEPKARKQTAAARDGAKGRPVKQATPAARPRTAART
jgi:membrane-bound lytic murein transglycosylase D